jgi:cholesterol oxidase
MTGAWSPDPSRDAGDLEQYIAADEAGEADGRTVDLRLVLASDDVERLSDDLSRPLTVTGTIAIEGLLDAPAEVEGGWMQLVVADEPADPDMEHMRYHLPLPSVGLHVDGFKVLDQGVITQLWGASTTLYTTIRRDGPDGEVVGRGIVRVHPLAFAKQVASFRIHDEGNPLRQAELLARFGARFFGALWDDYGSIVQRSSGVRRGAPRPHRPLAVPAPTISGYRTEDGLDLRLTRYRGGDRGPVVLVHGMGANNLTYTLDTIQPNLVEYLVGHGFDVWLQEWRGSTALPTSKGQFDADQVARFDNPAAEAAIREATGRHELHWVTHCVGSMTWMMSTLGGWTTPASVVFSQVGAHPVGPRITKIKAGLRAPNLLRKLGVKLLTTDSWSNENRRARMLDRALRLYPIPHPEKCDSAVCRRLAFIYGIAVHHPAVDELTHETLYELFGVTNLRMMAHLGRCAREQRLVTADGQDAYLPHVERAKLPMTFLSGAHNLVWVPESTQLDYDWLTTELGDDGFVRTVFPLHGHQDAFMGAEAYEQAFPAVLDHLVRCGC